MSGEVDHPTINVPRAIVIARVINGMIGLSTMLSNVFNLGDLDSVWEVSFLNFLIKVKVS